METTTFTQSNYINDYNSLQLSLPLNLGIKIDSNSEVVSFLKAIEGVNLGKYLKRDEGRGRKGHDRVMILKVILFAYSLGERELRKMEELCRNDIRFLYLSDESTPSHMTFERLMKNYLIKDIDDIFFEVSLSIGSKMNIDTHIQYIDGTKIEANANKNTFVYKKRILNAREKLFPKITELIIRMNMELGYAFPYHYFYCAQEIGYMLQYLMETMVTTDTEIVYGKGKRKTAFQKYYDEFMEYYTKLDGYEYWLDIIGSERNSCSKTDHDATMCATKMDYYCNTGLSRPCYNAQIAVSDGIIVNADLYQRAGDTKTFIPFMERNYEYTGRYPEYPVTDAGYGSYDNYMFCLTHDIKLFMKYPMYAKKNTADFQKKIYNTINWKKNEFGFRICPNGEVFNCYLHDHYEDDGTYLKIKQLYTTEEDKCEACPHKQECCKSERRVISRDVVLEEFYATVDENLSTEYGKELKKQRSIQAEGAFGVIKQDMKFIRFTRRGIENAKMEFLLVCLGYNLKKFHLHRLKEMKKETEISIIN